MIVCSLELTGPDHYVYLGTGFAGTRFFMPGSLKDILSEDLFP